MAIRERRGVLTRILSWPSVYVFIISFAIGGMALCGASLGLHIGELTTKAGSPFTCKTGEKCEGSGKPCVEGISCEGRQVGYLWAPNWSITYGLLGPLALFALVEALKGMRGATTYFYQSGMVRNDLLQTIKENHSEAAWCRGTRLRDGMMIFCAVVIPAALAYPEWYAHNFERLRLDTCVGCEPSDYDWGLAAVMHLAGSRPGWFANSMFDLAAFSCEAMLIGAAIGSFLYLADLSQVLPGPESRVRLRLLPNLRSDDSRRGFQKFEDPLHLMLIASLTFYLVCYAIRVNRIYMRSAGFTSLSDFIQRDITGLVASKVVELKGAELLAVLLTPPSEPRYQEFFAGIALTLVSFFSLAVIARTVGRAADQAKANAVDYYEGENPKSLFGLDVGEERKRAKSMTTWPLEWRYFQLDALAAIALTSVVILWFYRIGLYIFLLVVAVLLARIGKVLGK